MSKSAALAAVARGVLGPGRMACTLLSVRTLRALSLFLAAALPLATAACKSDDDDNGDADGDGFVDDGAGGAGAGVASACGQIFDAAQSLSNRCLYGAPLDSDLRPSEREGYVRGCSITFGQPGSSADLPSGLARCAAHIAAASCDIFMADDELSCPEFDHPIGARKAGEACDEDAQCESGACASERDDTCGVCARAAGEGESCEADDVACGPGLRCRPTGEGQGSTCQRLRREGEACERDCEAGLICDGGACKAGATLPKAGEACEQFCAFGSLCLESKCVALPGENEGCRGPDENGSRCAPGLSCDETKNTCQRRFQGEIDPGGACGEDDYCKGGYCDGGTCVAYAKLGEACVDYDSNQGEANSPPPCGDGHVCREGKCAEWAPACPAR
jgi:hypothetical protein